MNRITTAIIFATFIIACAGETRAGRQGKNHIAQRGEFSFQVESQGYALPIYTHRGRSYIEGTYGSRYAVRVFNHTGERVEAVVTVDGRDVISGQVGNYKKGRGYVIAPYDSVLIEGFRSNWNNVAAFRFTDIGDAYATRMGDASNVGVIGVAVFKEKQYRPRPRPLAVPRHNEYGKRDSRKRKSGLGTGYGAEAPAPSASQPKSRSHRGSRAMESDDYAGSPEREHRQSLGTEYGETTYSPSERTTFTRRSRRPQTVLAIRYDDREGLYAKGVLPRPHWPRPYHQRPTKPNPFPHSPEPVTFAPPPPPRIYY